MSSEEIVASRFQRKSLFKKRGQIGKTDGKDGKRKPLRKPRDNSNLHAEDQFPGKAPISRQKIQKYSRVKNERPSGMKTKFHLIENKIARKKKVFAVEQTARSDLLLFEESGYIEADEGEDTLALTQSKIAESVDITSATKYFDIKDVKYGPFSIDYSRNGRFLLRGGRKGHITAMKWSTKALLYREPIIVPEEIYAVKWLNNDAMFAAAQKRWTFIYDKRGIEIHCIKQLYNVLRMEYLPYQFLLATSSSNGYLSWLDVSIGQMVTQYQSKKGRLDVMCQNAQNATLALGHPNGTVTMWSPSSRKPLLSMLCHKRPVRAVAIDPSGTYMATAAIDRTLKIWDLRNSYECLYNNHISAGASQLAFSQTTQLAASMGNVVEIFKDCCKEQIVKPYLRHRGCEPINDIQFCPYEDVLGIGHLAGFTQIVVPGSGEANFDALECNPYQSKSQRREADVKALLEKVPSELVDLDPTRINKLDMPTLKEKIEAQKKIIFVKPPKVDFEPRHKMKGRSSAKKDIQRKKGVQELAKLVKIIFIYLK
uniref:BING4 C-terminal domain-containing protein n=1 Tax=Strigamia maritima TaxID=126957 RepID=T1JJV8_STRMM